MGTPVAKMALMLAPTSFTAGATATGFVDTMGADRVQIVISASAANATTKWTTLKLTEGDTTDATNQSNISGAVGGTDFTIPNAATSDVRAAAVFDVDCRARKRYIGFAAAPVTTQIVRANAFLTKLEAAPTTGTAAGADVLVGL